MVIQELFAVLGVEYSEAQFRSAEMAVVKLQTAFTGLGHAVAFAAAAAGVGAIFKAISDVADMGFEIQRTSEKLGITTDSLQELRFAAQSAGVDASKLEIGMQFLATKMLNASHGSFEAMRNLNAMGVSSVYLHGKLKPLDVALGEIATKFHKMGPETLRTALARFGFGRAGAALIPFFELLGTKGKDGIAALAKEFGNIMSPDLIARSVEHAQAIIAFKQALLGLKIALFGQELPMTKIITQLTKWINLNREWMAQGFKHVLDNMVDGLDAVRGAITLVVMGWQDIIEIIQNFSKEFSIIRPLVIAGALAMAVAFAPVTSAVVAIIAVLDDFYNFKTDKKDTLFGALLNGNSGLFDPITGQFVGFRSWLKAYWESLANDFYNSTFANFIPLFALMKAGVWTTGAVSDALANLTQPGGILTNTPRRDMSGPGLPGGQNLVTIGDIKVIVTGHSGPDGKSVGESAYQELVRQIQQSHPALSTPHG